MVGLTVLIWVTVDEIKSWPTLAGWYISPESGNRVKLGDGVNLGDGVTSESLNEALRLAYSHIAAEHIFTKWVTSERKSPNFDGGILIEYNKGAVIEEPEAKVSDRQCAVGLHVLRYGYRPEWIGLCGADHELIPLRVWVKSEDIMFAGLPTMDAKIRVRRLEVID